MLRDTTKNGFQDAVVLMAIIITLLAAEEARQRLATWAHDDAVPSKDYVVDEDGDRTYKTESLKPWVEPLLREMNLAVGDSGDVASCANEIRNVNTRCIESLAPDLFMSTIQPTPYPSMSLPVFPAS